MESDSEATTILGENKSEWPEVAIVILNWNNYEDTAECLESIEEIEYPNYQVTVVDNNSTDGSYERLQDEFQWCDFIQNESNLGYAEGVNTGIQNILENNPKYILLLNNDTIVDRSFLTPLVETAERNCNVGIVSGVIRFADTNDIQSAGRQINPYLMKAPYIKSTQNDSEYEVECISGAMALFSSDFLREVNGLDESYFLGPDDIDISMEAKRMGKKILINPNSVVHHKDGGSGGTGNAFRYYHATKGRLYLAAKFLSLHQRLLFYLLFGITRMMRIFQWFINGNYKLIISIILGSIDHFKGDTKKERLYILKDW